MAKSWSSSKQNSSNKEKFNEAVSKIAYELYLKKGSKSGNELGDWLEAEKIYVKKYSK